MIVLIYVWGFRLRTLARFRLNYNENYQPCFITIYPGSCQVAQTTSDSTRRQERGRFTETWNQMSHKIKYNIIHARARLISERCGQSWSWIKPVMAQIRLLEEKDVVERTAWRTLLPFMSKLMNAIIRRDDSACNWGDVKPIHCGAITRPSERVGCFVFTINQCTTHDTCIFVKHSSECQTIHRSVEMICGVRCSWETHVSCTPRKERLPMNTVSDSFSRFRILLNLLV